MPKKKIDTESYKNQIITFLNAYNKRLMPISELKAKCRTQRAGKSGEADFDEAFSQLRTEGIVTVRKGMKAALCSRLGLRTAVITRLSRTFGFAETDDEYKEEYFIPGKCMLGAMPGDRVLISDIPSRSGEPEGEVEDILSFGSQTMTGRIEYDMGRPYFVPDISARSHLIIDQSDIRLREGDKVMAEIVFRGRRHAEHRVRITEVFGSADIAASCAEAVIASHGVVSEFPPEVLSEARKISEGGVQEYSVNNRRDLRDMPIFTIDEAESKDLDDAVSVERHGSGYLLGVHIADVSYYVKGNSELDKEALRRGTSIYYADKVIPMLPKELSNGICSLNPGEDRLTLSAFAELDSEGELVSYSFCKSVIRSRVKGVYSEVNRLLDGDISQKLAEKYAAVLDELPVLSELADKLTEKRRRRHAPELETTESKLIINEDGVCVGAVPRVSGRAERMIEEFMLTANEAAAKLSMDKKVPFVYRIHETPPEAKTEALCEMLLKAGIDIPPFTEFKPQHAADILDNARDTEMYEAVNMMVLRSMAKAKYSEEPLGHFGLALDDYSHFTSPIRRYPDLAIHRIITDILAGYDQKWLRKRYEGFVRTAAEESTNAEIRAVSIERECEDIYKAEYMKQHIGEVFTGRISGVTEFGFYVELPDTVEGLVHVRSLPEGEYDYSEPIALTERFSGVSYTLGMEVQVICAAVNVSEGTIDFVLDDDD